MSYRRVAQLRSAKKLHAHLNDLDIDLPFDETVASDANAPLAQPIASDHVSIGNRFCVLPMEGWDGTLDGYPTELTTRRWRRFGESGAKLIWGGEAVAVQHDGRANPNQLQIDDDHTAGLAQLRQVLVDAHGARIGPTDDLLVGLQLTHSGRFSRPDPDHILKPVIAYRHPLLDAKFGISPDYPLITDDEIRALIERFVYSAVLAQQAGFDFVDIKHCHGYFGHELLTAYDRPGPFGGSFENRTRFLREIVDGIRRDAPGLGIGVRLSAFDWVPFRPNADGVGEPAVSAEYEYAFGGDQSGIGIDLTEPIAFLELLDQLDINLVNLSAGSPYYTPHLLRPALFPPSDGYLPPEDPLAGVARHIVVAAKLKQRFPNLIIVGSGYSYLQEWLPNVAQAVVRQGLIDSVGLGRIMLSYPHFASDILAGRPLQRKLVCRTFSDCTTAPRKGMISGCFPLDEFYKQRPAAAKLRVIKAEV